MHCTLQSNNSFTQTLYSRFVKEMIAATDTNHDGMINLEELKKVLDNIGAEGQVTREELVEFFDSFEDPHTDDSGEKLLDVHAVQEFLTQIRE